MKYRGRGRVPDWTEFSKEVEKLLWSYAVAISIAVSSGVRRYEFARRI